MPSAQSGSEDEMRWHVWECLPGYKHSKLALCHSKQSIHKLCLVGKFSISVSLRSRLTNTKQLFWLNGYERSLYFNTLAFQISRGEPLPTAALSTGARAHHILTELWRKHYRNRIDEETKAQARLTNLFRIQVFQTPKFMRFPTNAIFVISTHD